jgi:hypothetical protein
MKSIIAVQASKTTGLITDLHGNSVPEEFLALNYLSDDSNNKYGLAVVERDSIFAFDLNSSLELMFAVQMEVVDNELKGDIRLYHTDTVVDYTGDLVLPFVVTKQGEPVECSRDVKVINGKFSLKPAFNIVSGSVNVSKKSSRITLGDTSGVIAFYMPTLEIHLDVGEWKPLSEWYEIIGFENLAKIMASESTDTTLKAFLETVRAANGAYTKHPSTLQGLQYLKQLNLLGE